MDPLVSDQLGLLRRNRALLALAVLPLVLGVLLGVLGAAGVPLDEGTRSGGWGLLATIGLAAAGWVWFADPRPCALQGRLEAGEEGVRWNGRLIAPRRALQGGFLVPMPDGRPVVRLERRWPRKPIALRAPDAQAGRAVLEALGLDASHTTATFTFASRARTDVRLALIAPAVLLALFLAVPAFTELASQSLAVATAVVASCFLAFGAYRLLLVLPTRVVVGADGVLVTWLGRSRFVRYEDVRGVRPFGRGNVQGVALWLASGQSVKLPIRTKLAQEQNRQEIALVIQRIQESIASFRARRAGGEAALPERAGRDAATWVRALRAAGSGASADHRTAPVPADGLWRIVEDPSADPATRATAAVALGGALDAPAKKRLRIAAETTASPEMRQVLELAAEEAAEDEVGAALEKIAKVAARG